MGNSLGMELENKYVILTNDYIYYKEDELLIGTPEERVFLCTGGFGCHSYTSGTLIGGSLIAQQYRMAIRGIGGSIERLATKEEIQKAKELGKNAKKTDN